MSLNWMTVQQTSKGKVACMHDVRNHVTLKAERVAVRWLMLGIVKAKVSTVE